MTTNNEWRRFGPDAPERAALLALSAHLGITLRPGVVQLPTGTPIEIEGLDHGGGHLVQAVLNQGIFTSAHRNKVQADLFKLLWLRTTRFPTARIALILSPTTVTAVRPRSWTALAVGELDVDIYLFDQGVLTVVTGQESMPLNN